MPSSPRYFLREDGRRTGPHSLAVLKQKAELGLLTANSPLAPEAEPEAWAPLGDSQVLREELLTAHTHYTLGKREVETVNHAENPATPSVESILRGNLARQREVEGELLKPLPPRSNRRRNDYLIAAIAGNLLAAIGFIYLPGNPITFVYLIAFVTLYNTGLVWILFFVMDRY